MDVEREGVELQAIGEGFDEVEEEARGWGNRVEHSVGMMRAARWSGGGVIGAVSTCAARLV